MTPRPFAPLVVLCGAIALAIWSGGSEGIGSSDIANTAIALAANSVDEAAADPDPPETAAVLADLSAAGGPVSSLDSRPTTQPEKSVRLVSLSTLKEVPDYPQLAVRPLETPDECHVTEACIDEYLWSLYERTTKIDTNKLTEKIKTTLSKNGKKRTVIKSVIKYVLGDFTWKDPIAARRADKPLK